MSPESFDIQYDVIPFGRYSFISEMKSNICCLHISLSEDKGKLYVFVGQNNAASVAFGLLICTDIATDKVNQYIFVNENEQAVQSMLNWVSLFNMNDIMIVNGQTLAMRLSQLSNPNIFLVEPLI